MSQSPSQALPTVSRSGAGLGTVLLGLSIFATGFCGLVSEFILSTVSSYILGNAVEQFSVIIALMMLMMGLAAAVQRFFPDRNLLLQFVGVEMLLALLGGFAPLAIYAAYGSMEDHFALVLYGTAMSIGFLIGFELPLVLRINAGKVTQLRSNLALILSLDYVGGFVGALVWTRLLLHKLPLTESSFVIALFNFGVAAVTFWYLSRGEFPPRLRAAAAGGIAIVAALLAIGWSNNRVWSEQLEQRLYDDRIVFSETTQYQRIVLTQNLRQRETRLFLNGNLQFSSLDEAVYHENLVHPAMSIAARRERVLILGGGDGLALREVLKYPDVVEVALVDIDSRMTEIASTHPALVELSRASFADARVRALPAQGISGGAPRPVFQSHGRAESGGRAGVDRVARVEVIHVDAHRFVDGVSGPWDVVLIDFPDPSSVELTKLYSREFYRRLRGVLAPDAVMALQATSPYHAREAYLCIARTLQSAGFRVMPYHDNVPSFGSWGWLLAAPESRAGATLANRLKRVARFEVDTSYLTPELMHGSLVFGKDRLRAERNGINTLMHPVLLDLYLHHSWLEH